MGPRLEKVSPKLEKVGPKLEKMGTKIHFFLVRAGNLTQKWARKKPVGVKQYQSNGFIFAILQTSSSCATCRKFQKRRTFFSFCLNEHLDYQGFC